MTHFNSKEEKFKEILGGLEFELDTDAVWAEVQSELPTDDKIRLPFFFWMLSMGVGLMFMSVLYYAVTESSEHALTEYSETILSMQETVQELDGVKTYEAAIEKVVAEKEMDETQNDKPLKTTQHIDNIKVQNFIPVQAAEGIGSTANQKTNTQHQSIIHTSTSFSNHASTFLQQSHSVMTTPKQVMESSKAASLLPSILNLPSLQLIINSKTKVDEEQQLVFDDSNFIIPQRRKLSPFFLLSAGPNMNMTSYSPSQQESAFPDQNTTLDMENGLLGYSAQLLCGIQSNRWRGHLGLMYSFQASGFTNHNHISAQEEIQGVESFTVSSDGEVDPQNGTILKTTESQLGINWYRKHSNINASLGIGRHLLSFGSWHLGADAALTYNLYSKNTGYYLDEHARGATQIEDGDISFYKTRNGIGSLVNLSISRDLTSAIALEIRPYYSTVLNPINSNITSYKMKNSQVGLQMGISYRPNWE